MTNALAGYLEPGIGSVRFAQDAFIVPDGRSIGEVVRTDPWLVADVLGPLFAVDRRGFPLYRDCWLQQSRGDGKTTTGAVFGLTTIFMRQMCETVVAAADKDQAGFMAEAARGFVERSPVLRGSLEVLKDEVRCASTGSRFKVISSDAASSWGIGANVRALRIICDELTAWPERGESLYHSLLTSTSKVPDSQFIVLTNAGVLGTWQEDAFNRIKAAA